MKNSNLEKLLSQYGGEKHLEIPDSIKVSLAPIDQEQELRALAMPNDSEITGLVGLKTKYMEDVKVGNHSSAWGSYFDVEQKKWGFKCCKSLDKSNKRCKLISVIE